MRQRPQEIIKAFGDAGHPAYFVDPSTKISYRDGNVTVVPTLDLVPRSNVLLYIHFAPVAHLVDRFDGPTVIYDILDDLSIYEPDEVGLPIERTVAYHHPQLMESADLVIASAPELVRRHEHERSDIILAENGVDVTRFHPEGPRQELGSGQIIGYHGAVAHWFDFDLLRAVAEAHPEWTFPIVGPVRPDVQVDADDVALPNVNFLGERSPDEIGSYVRSFTAGVVWFKVNRLTEGVSPLKVFEWLASGVAPVSVPLPAVTGHPLVEVGHDAASMGVAIKTAVAQPSNDAWRQRAAAAAQDAAWHARLAPVFERLAKLQRRSV